MMGDLSEGKFDITIGKLTQLWGFTGEDPKVPSAEKIFEMMGSVDYKKVKIEGNTVTLLDPDAAVDLGGIAKGYIADRFILQSIGREDTKDITFTVHKKDLEESKQILEEHKETLRFDHIETDESIGKVSIVGAGLMSNCGVAARMFEALYEAGINIQMINTSEIRVSVLLDEEDVNRAVRAIHDKFFGEI